MAKPTLQEKVTRMEKRMDDLEKLVSRSLGEEGRKRLLNSEEAACFLGITVEGLRGLTHKKLISYYKPNGKNIYFDADELVAWQKKNHFEPVTFDKESVG